MTRPAPLTTTIADAQRRSATVVLRCTHCDAPIVNPERLFADLCDPCGREYACDNPDALGPDA